MDCMYETITRESSKCILEFGYVRLIDDFMALVRNHKVEVKTNRKRLFVCGGVYCGQCNSKSTLTIS